LATTNSRPAKTLKFGRFSELVVLAAPASAVSREIVPSVVCLRMTLSLDCASPAAVKTVLAQQPLP
jgi:hypothetical protein